MLTVVLFALAITVVSLAVVFVSPTRQCVRCKGERVIRHRWTGKITGCPRCNGTGRHYRRGAVAVSGASWALRGAIRSELKQRGERATTATTVRPGTEE